LTRESAPSPGAAPLEGPGTADFRLGWLATLAWLPLPLILLAELVLLRVELRTPYGSAFLFLHLNFLFLILTSALVIHRLGRTYRRSREPWLLLLMAGALMQGAWAILASLPDFGEGPGAGQVQAVCLWAASCCHLAAVLLLARPGTPPRASRVWLAVAGVATLVLGGWLGLRPPARVPAGLGSGLATATIAALFAAAGILAVRDRRAPSAFGRFYAAALALFALGALGRTLDPVPGGLLGWTGHWSQFLGGAYLVLAALGRGGPAPQAGRAFLLLRRVERFWPFAVLFIVTAAWGFRALFLPGLEASHPFITFYPAVLLAALAGGMRGGLLATLLSGFVVDWCLITPGSLVDNDPAQRAELLVFLVGSCLITSVVGSMLKARARASQAETRAQVEAERAVAAEALRDREIRFRLLAEATSEGIAILDGRRIVDANDRFCQMLGRGKEAILGEELDAILPGSDRAGVLDAVLEDDGRMGELSAIRGDGTVLDVEATARPFMFEGQARRMVALRDVTARRKAQAVAERYHLIARHARDPLILVDVEGRVEEANQAAVDFYGYAHDELVALSIQDLRVDEPGIVRRQIREARNRGTLFETIHRRKDGTQVQVEVNARSITLEGQERILSVIRDISERKRMEGELLQTVARMQAFLAATTESIWLFSPEGRVVLANPTAARRVGRPQEDLVGRLMDEFVPPDVAAARRAVLAQVAATREPMGFEDERDGISFHHSFYPVLDEHGQVSGVGSFTRDITQAKRSEEILRKNHHRLETLAAAMAALLHQEDPEALMESLARQCMVALDCQVFLNLLAGPAGNLYLYSSSGLRPEDTVTFEAACSKAPDCACDAREDASVPCGPGFCPPAHLASGYGIKAFACRSLLGSDGRIFGTLAFGAEREAFNEGDLALINALSTHLSIALEKQKSKEVLRLSNEDLERRVAERTVEVQGLVSRLRALALELTQAEQRERQRLALVLHDHLQQLLVAARMKVDLIQLSGGEDMPARFGEVDAILREAIEASRSLAVELCPPILQQGGLLAALTWLAQRLAAQSGFQVDIQADPGAEPAEESLKLLLFNSVRELVLNSAKHSGVKEARVTLAREGGGWLKLVVEDDGRGIDPAALARGQGGFGLFNIQQRLAHVGGRMEIAGGPGEGTRTTIYARNEAKVAKAPLPKGAGSPGARITILLVEGHPAQRGALEDLLAEEDDLEVVGVAKDGEEARELVRRLQPHVVVVDAAAPGPGGAELARRLWREKHGIRIIGFSSHAEAPVDALRGPASDLLRAIRETQASAGSA